MPPLAVLERGEPCDLMLADFVMPGLSGADTASLARRTRPDLKVLFCSGYAELSRFVGDVSNEWGRSVLLYEPDLFHFAT